MANTPTFVDESIVSAQVQSIDSAITEYQQAVANLDTAIVGLADGWNGEAFLNFMGAYDPATYPASAGEANYKQKLITDIPGVLEELRAFVKDSTDTILEADRINGKA